MRGAVALGADPGTSSDPIAFIALAAARALVAIPDLAAIPALVAMW